MGKTIRQGRVFGNLTVLCDSGIRKNGYIVWRCSCGLCGKDADIGTKELQRGSATDCGCSSRGRGAGKIKPGDVFGKLTVLSDSGERKNGSVVWNCECECGNNASADTASLRRGTVTDCGCGRDLSRGKSDITGQRFGLLTAEYCTGRTVRHGGYIWHMKCDCGGEIDVPLAELRSGDRKSCGCLSHPPLKDFIGKKFGRLTVLEYAGKENGNHRWRCLCECGRETVVSQTLLQSGRTRSCGCLRAEVYESNLKLVGGTSVTVLETRMNRLASNNTSGYTGVYYNSRRNRWCAQLRFRGKTYNLGSYEDKADAVKARQRGEEVYGDFLSWYYGEYLPGKKKEAV